MKYFSLFLFAILFSTTGFSQKKQSYQLYTAKGKKVKYKKLLKNAAEADMVFFGELHNNAIAHWLQLELTKDLYENKKNLILGAEMFEADNQAALNQYLAGTINEDTLAVRARLWPNYGTDYAPLVDFAKDNKLPFIATNIPRYQASAVYKGGFEALEAMTPEEKQWSAPLPISYDPDLPGYHKMKEMMAGHGGDNLPKAQAIKDATMAHFIWNNYKAGQLFIHYNGSYHSDKHVGPVNTNVFADGIPYFLTNYQADLSILLITTITQADISTLDAEHYHKAHFILVVDEDVTNTYKSRGF